MTKKHGYVSICVCLGLNTKTQTVESLQAIATELSRTAETLRMRANDLEEDGIKELDIPHYTILVRGMGYIESFVNGVRKAHLDYRESQGAFKK